MSQFDKFTEHARRVLTLAQEEAQRFNHYHVGTEHLLLGLVRERDGVAARVLSNMGVQPPKVRSAVEFIIGRGEGAVVGEIGLTPRAKKVIELAVDEARRLNHHYIGTQHLLVGLVREGEGVAAGVLESLGVKLDRVRTDVQLVARLPPDPEPGLEIPLVADNETESKLRVEDWRNSGASVTAPPDSFSEGAQAVLRCYPESSRTWRTLR